MRQCSRCSKSSIKSTTRKKLRGKYNPTVTGRRKANLQWTNLLDPERRLLVCTRCLKTLTQQK